MIKSSACTRHWSSRQKSRGKPELHTLYLHQETWRTEESMKTPIMTNEVNRREFLKTSALATACVAAFGAAPNTSADATGGTLRVGLIGCGGRGTGAAAQALNADGNVKLVAMG